MKKFLYIVALLLVLLAIAYVLQSNRNANTTSEPAVAQEEVVAVDVEPEGNTVVVVDEEPAAEEEEIAAEDVVEDNPDATSEEGETIID